MLLLVILVSFVSSLATSIVTISMIDEKMPPVTQTINQVVERTIEKVVPQTIVQTVTKEVPITSNEGELVARAVRGSQTSLVRLQNTELEGGENVVALCWPDRRLFITLASALPAETGWEVSDATGNNETSRLVLVKKDDTNNLAVFKAISGPAFTDDWWTKKSSPALGGTIGLGQTVVGLSLNQKNEIELAVGLTITVPETATSTSLIRTTSARGDLIGGLLLSIKGEIVGLLSATNYALPASRIKAVIDSIK